MANFKIDIPDDFMKKLQSLGAKLDDIAPKMIDGALPILEKSVKRQVSKHKASGDLIESVKISKARAAKNGGYYGSVGFVGYGTHKYKNTTQKVANSIKAIALEYGTSKQQAQPFLSASVHNVEQDVLQKMQDIFNAEVEK
jgi:HK97 gp10 family phage protein